MKKETSDKLVSWLGATLVRLLSRTLRLCVDDRVGFLSGGHKDPIIFAYWHNRMLSVIAIYLRRYVGLKRTGVRKGGVVLVSRSRDGRHISNIIERYGIGAANGSSSRGGASALLELTDAISRGLDVNITPDGPRGPRYQLTPGVIFLAQKTAAPICMIHVECRRCFRFKSWDGFMVPLPFSRVEIIFDNLQYIPPAMTELEFEAERTRIEKLMQPVTQ